MSCIIIQLWYSHVKNVPFQGLHTGFWACEWGVVSLALMQSQSIPHYEECGGMLEMFGKWDALNLILRHCWGTCTYMYNHSKVISTCIDPELTDVDFNGILKMFKQKTDVLCFTYCCWCYVCYLNFILVLEEEILVALGGGIPLLCMNPCINFCGY